MSSRSLLHRLMALGMTPVIISGGIDISVGSILGICGVCTVSCSTPICRLESGLLATLLGWNRLGAFNGAVIAYFKLPPFVVTLATLSIGRSLALVVSNNQVFYEFGRAPRR